MAPKVCGKNKWRPFFGVQTKNKVFMMVVGKNLKAKVTQQNFSGKLGEIRAKILRTSKNLLATTPVYCGAAGSRVLTCKFNVFFMKSSAFL